MTAPLKIYICHEPDAFGLAAHLTAWPRTNDQTALYEARQRIPPASPEATELKQQLLAAMAGADVFVCLIEQATGFDEWVSWEIAGARSLSPAPGMVGILLHEADPKPPLMVDAGAIFVPFQRDKVERAIEWAGENRRKSGDFKFIDE